MNAAKTDLPNRPPKRRKLWRWLAGLLLFYTVFGFLILPPILRAVAVKQLSRQLDREVSIEQIKLNPFALSTTIRGLLIKDKDGQPFVSWTEVYVNLQLASFLGHPWVFQEISTSNTFVRVQMNKDYSLNFSDLIAKFSTNTPAPATPPAARPLAVQIHRLHIAGATTSLTDLTPRTPFRRVIGPLDITLDQFRTAPDNKNPYSFSGVTDGGETISWSGFFFLDPLRSGGEIALENISLNKYAPLYQDLVRFQIRDGVVDLRSDYRFEFSAANRVVIATNASFKLHSFKLAEPGSDENLMELPEFSVTGASLDAVAHRGEITAITGTGGRLNVRRDKDAAINVVEISKPVADAQAAGGIVLLLRSVTNIVAQLLDSTNAWSGTIHGVNFQDSALNLTDLVNARPVALNLDHISLTASNLSNVPGAGLTASLALRWNTNGTLRTDVTASLHPLTADVQIALDRLELRPLDPYLETLCDLFVIDSKLGLNGQVHWRTPKGELPQVTFTGDAWLNDFSTVDGNLGEDLLKWSSVRVSGIDANLNPLTVAIKEVAANDAYVRLIIETNRSINLLAALRLENTNAPTAAPSEKPARDKKFLAAQIPASVTNALALPDLTIASVAISNAQIRFTDRSLTPTVNLSIQQAGGTIAGLSTRQLQHADVNLRAKVDNVGPVSITGTINPFDESSTNEIKVTAQDVDLSPTSPYSGKFAGYQIAKGKLNLALAYHLQGRQLKSENLITLDQFTFGEKVDSPDATKLPVRLGVAILKDRSGKIQLDVPIEGSLDDPKFKLHKVIVRAIENILFKIVTSPFAALGAIFGGKAEELNYQDFAPGSFALQSNGTNKLEALVKGLYERPGLRLEISGSVAAEADRDGLRRVALEKQLRTEKWQSLWKSERATTTPDQMVLTPEERSRLLKRIYGATLSKDQAPAETNSVPAPAPAPITRRFTRTEPMKGATLLMHRPEILPTTLSTNAVGVVSQVESPENEIEQALLNQIAISDSDLATLAADRAKAVRAYILQTGKVEAERIFLTENHPGGVKTNGSKAFLQLQ